MSTSSVSTEVVVLDGTVHVRTVGPDGAATLDPCLTPSGVDRLFRVSTGRSSKWADRYGPLADLPEALTYPSHVEGGHVVVNGRRLVRTSAVRAWYAATFGDRAPSKNARALRQDGRP